MDVDLESFRDVLKHPIRRKVILALSQTESLSYTDLMGATGSANTGKFNYHLKILADLIQKDESGKYRLTGKGQLAAQFLQAFKEKKNEPSPLRMADAALIGFVGLVVALSNPGYWGFLQAAAMNSTSAPLLSAFEGLGFGFGLIVPGAVMWMLAVRRSHSHDFYDVFKAPVVACGLLFSLLVFMLVFGFSFGAQVMVPVGQTATSYEMYTISAPLMIFEGMIFSFLGVAITELIYRVKKRFALRR
jgi:hypothetical protein